MFHGRRLAAIALAIVMSFTATACAGKDTSESAGKKANPVAEIREEMMGDWQSVDLAYTLSVSYSEDHRIVQTLYHRDEVVESGYIHKYSYNSGYLWTYIGNIAYSYEDQKSDDDRYFYLDGDKMLFPYDGDWIRLNRVSAKGRYSGHSDVFIDTRKDLMGIWSCSYPSHEDVVFENVGKYADLAMRYVYNMDYDSNDNLIYDEKLYYVQDIVPSLFGLFSGEGSSYTIVATEEETGKTVNFLIQFNKEKLTITIDGEKKTMKNAFHGK